MPLQRAAWAATLPLLLSCDGIYVANPENCVVSTASCAVDSICNTLTKRCEPITRFVLGQPTPDVNLNLAWGLFGPQAVLLIADKAAGGVTKLLVADSGNNRVLIWNSVPDSNAALRPPDVVIGQPDLTTNQSNYASLSGRTLSAPCSLASDGVKLVVGDLNNSRLLIWNSIPSQSYPVANAVWGQLGPNAGVFNSPAGKSTATNLTGGYGYAIAGGGFLVSDTDNSRLLGFAAIPLNQTVAAVSAVGLTKAHGSPVADLAKSMIWLPDTGNHRIVSIGYSLLTGGFNFVGNFSAVAGVTGSAGAGSQLSSPMGVARTSEGATGHLWVADTGNNRVAAFPANGASTVDILLGQTDKSFSQANGGSVDGLASASTMNQPQGISSDGMRLAVADTANHRILLWNRLPTSSAAPADVWLGQRDASLRVPNSPHVITGLQFSGPGAVTGDAQHLIIADSGNNRVLIWNSLPRNNMTQPDVVIGQTDMSLARPNGGSPLLTASSLNNPAAVHFDGTHLAVADQGNNRVLIWSQLPTTKSVGADLIIGQNSPITNQGNQGGSPTASTLAAPSWVHQQAGRLFVADTGNHRVLIYNSPYQPTATADLVLGQGDMLSNGANAFGLNVGVSSPAAVVSDGSHLVVSDSGNNRVLIWNAPPSLSGQSADVVLGQTDFFGSAVPLRPGPDNFLAPQGLLIIGNQLMVADRGQHRLLFWRQWPTTLGQEADGILGQPDPRIAIQNSPTLPNIRALNAPSAMWARADRLYIADSGNNRVVFTTLP